MFKKIAIICLLSSSLLYPRIYPQRWVGDEWSSQEIQKKITRFEEYQTSMENLSAAFILQANDLSPEEVNNLIKLEEECQNCSFSNADDAYRTIIWSASETLRKNAIWLSKHNDRSLSNRIIKNSRISLPEILISAQNACEKEITRLKELEITMKVDQEIMKSLE